MRRQPKTTRTARLMSALTTTLAGLALLGLYIMWCIDIAYAKIVYTTSGIVCVLIMLATMLHLHLTDASDLEGMED